MTVGDIDDFLAGERILKFDFVENGNVLYRKTVTLGLDCVSVSSYKFLLPTDKILICSELNLAENQRGNLSDWWYVQHSSIYIYHSIRDYKEVVKQFRIARGETELIAILPDKSFTPSPAYTSGAGWVTAFLGNGHPAPAPRNQPQSATVVDYGNKCVVQVGGLTVELNDEQTKRLRLRSCLE